MNNLLKITGMLLGVFVVSACTSQTTLLTKDQVISINQSFNDSFINKDFSVYEKYLYEGTEIFIDLDPTKEGGLKKIEMKEFKQLALMSLELVEDMSIEDEVISVDIDAQTNQATLVTKSAVKMSMMGTKITEVSRATTVFGLIDGEIKILSARDEIISSEAK